MNIRSTVRSLFRPARLLPWVPVLAIGAAIAILARLGPRSKDELPEALPPKLVRVLVIEPKSVLETLTLPGRILPRHGATLAVEKPGRIVQLAVDKGDSVRRGDLLLQLDERLWVLQERDARIERDDAQRDLERWVRLHERGAVPQSELDALRRRLELAESSLEQAQVNVSQCRVISPFDGLIDARFVETGEYLSEGREVFRLLDLSTLKVLTHLPERDAGSVAVGDLKLVRASSAGPDPFEARVTFVSREATPRRLSYAVELEIPDPPSVLRPGMVADVEVLRALREGAVAVPLSAVIPRRGEHVVFVLEGGIAVRRPVLLESIVGREALLSAGLQAGDLLIIEGHRGLQDGEAVQLDPSRDGQESGQELDPP